MAKFSFFGRRLALALGICACSPTTPARTEEPVIVADAKKSAEWIAQALSQSGYKADFTIASLSELDRFFDEHAPNGAPIESGLLSDRLGNKIFSIGAYVGETVLRARKGAWVGDDSDREAEINISIRFEDGTIIWPVQRVMKRFKNGREDGLKEYGAVLTSSEY